MYYFKLLKKQGEYAGDIAYRINKIQNSLGIPMTQFDDIDPAWVSDEFSDKLSKEDIELRREEQEEGEWDFTGVVEESEEGSEDEEEGDW